MKSRQFKRYLASLGATFSEGSKHTKVYLNFRQSTLPRHSEEIGVKLQSLIFAQLGVKEKPK